MTRDSQRQKLYDAERAALDVKGLTMKRWETVPEMQAYVNKLLDSAWFKRHWPRKGGSEGIWLGANGFVFAPKVEVRDGRGHRRATYGGGVIQMPKWARKEWVMLHELAHYVTPQRPAHGWQFAANYLLLVQHQLGKEAADALRAKFKFFRVRYTKPRAKRPMTEEQKQVLRERLVKARAARRQDDRGRTG